jgi:DNA/RNA-binding domain of Phe-tRNA-synthetase-like protein
MRFIGQVLESYKEVNIGVLTCKGLKIRDSDPGLELAKSRALREALRKIGDEPVTRHPFVSSWRELYRSFGTKPADYRPSAEALVRRAIKIGGLPVINTAVDAYNTASLRYLIPMGGFDLDRIQGDIYLRFSGGGERFTPLGPAEAEETYSGEVVYADDERILTRRWNYRDCDETKITTETNNVVMFIDCTGEVPMETVRTALSDLQGLLYEFCGGAYESHLVNRIDRVVDLS